MIIRKETFAAALAATTTDDTRYYLRAVQVEPATNRVVSTNGHVLLIATDTNPIADTDFPLVPGAEYHGEPATMCVDGDIVRSMIAAMPKKSRLPVLSCAQFSRNGSESTATLAVTDLQAPRIATIDSQADSQRFPAYDKVMEPLANRAGVKVTLAVDVLETLIKAAKAAAGKSKALITFDVPTGSDHLDKSNNVTHAIGVTMTGADITVTGCAMPCRL